MNPFINDSKEILNNENIKLQNNINKTKEIKNKTRYIILDNFKGILIFTVVFAHFLLGYSQSNKISLINKIVNIIYTFHMPAFIFCSGFLSKSENSKSFNNIIRLLLIYFIFNFLHGFILCLYKKIKINFLYPYNSYWYIICLIYWRISIQCFINQYFSIFISFIISFLIGFLNDINNLLSLKRAFIFYPYFLVGYKISKEKLDKILKLRQKFFILIILFFCFFLIISINYLPYIEINDSTMGNSYTNFKDYFILRLELFIFSSLIIIFSLLLIPNNNLYLITKIGKNTLYIYLFHRIITIIIDYELFSKIKNELIIIFYSVFFTIIILVIFGSNCFVYKTNKYIDFIHINLINNNKRGKLIKSVISLFFIFILTINPFFVIIKEKQLELENIHNISLKRTLINNFDFEKAIRISYIGDLILLKDQVISAKNISSGKYEFDEMFKYTSDYFKKSDLTIGIYEGPSAGNKTSFSSSNYGDGLPLTLNFPDEFAESIKNAGINFVSTANNHLLDKNLEGALRTIDILNKYNINHTGSYKNKVEQNKILLINVKGINFAFLSYVSNVNYWNMENLYEQYPFLTNIIPNSKNKYYNQIYENIKRDFKKAKNLNADYIIVIAHMGTDFSHNIDNFQKKWNKIFSDLGANIILGDHSHAVQPLEILNNTFIVNCPGNFANSYIKNDGDANSIVDLYFDHKSKKFIGSSIIPMYTQEFKTNFFRALPIFKIINNSINISSIEKLRINEINKLVTKIMIQKEISINEIREKYYFINGSYFDISNNRTKIKNIINEKFKNKLIIKLIQNSNSITFIGDSITEGTKNNYHPWYEPLIYYFYNKIIINISKGSYTTSLIIKDFKYHILKSKSNLYIIALGTNDVRYRDPEICAMTKEQYIRNIQIIVNLAKKSNINSKFVFISPWLSLPDDKISKLNETNKNKLLEEYGNSLKNFCQKNNYLFINPNNYIWNLIKKNPKKYIIDQIHPNENEGIQLYSESVLINSK